MPTPRLTTLALVGALLTAGALTVPSPQPRSAASAPAAARAADPRSLHERVVAWSPTAKEQRFMAIPWSEDVDAALARAKRENRLIFAMVSNGDLCTGRL